MQLNWQVITTPDDPSYFCPGTELESALCGESGRFLIVVVRTLDDDYLPSSCFHIRDAETVTLTDVVKKGKRPETVATFQCFDNALKFVEGEEEERATTRKLMEVAHKNSVGKHGIRHN